MIFPRYCPMDFCVSMEATFSCLAGNEVLGIAAVEGPVRIRRKGECAHTGTAPPVIGMPADESVDGLSVGGRDIFYIINPLVSSFDFKGGDPGRNQVRYGIHQIQIFEGEEKFVLQDFVSVTVRQGVVGPAGLGADAAIAAAARHGLTHITLPAVGNA